MNGQYLTIKEFSKKAGVSPQYVYKEIRDGKLTQYTEIVDGKKVLKPEALEIIGKRKHDNKNSTNDQSIVSLLRDQLNEKDRQIEELHTELQRSQELLQRSQELLKREQDIRIVTEKRLLLLEGQQIEEPEETTSKAEKAVTDDSKAVTGASGRADQGQNNGRRRKNPIDKQVGKRSVTFWDRFRRGRRG